MPGLSHAMTIVVGYDGSDSARRVLERVRDQAPAGARVVVVSVTPELPTAGLASVADRAPDAAARLEEAREQLGARLEVTTHARDGDPGAVLVEVARREHADVVVIGRRGTDFVARTLLGSAAQRVVEQAPCDVVVVA